MRRRWRIGLFPALMLWVLAGRQGHATAVPATGAGLFAPAAMDADEPAACPANQVDSLETDGILGKPEPGTKPPRPINTVEAEFSKQARKTIRDKNLRPFSATSLLSFIVDRNGAPRDICLVKPAGYGLDAEALKALRKYTFDPAKKDGVPVPARISIEINFRMR
jgi:TonB family protein